MPHLGAPRGPRRALALLAGALALSLLSCGREVTGPEGGRLRFADGLSFISEFPAPLQNVVSGSGSVIPFERVRVTFRRADGSVALDTAITFGATTDSIAISFRVPLSSSAPSSGEPMQMSLAYVNAAGDTVFRGGPTPVVAKALAPGEPPPAPVAVQLTYVGVGANAASVVLAPDSLTVVAGSPFTFTGSAFDAQAQLLATTPLVYSSLDPARAAVTNPGAGVGTTAATRGTARIVVWLPTGIAADTSILTILPKPGAIALVTGGGQTTSAGATLALPVTVRLNATDALPLAGATINAAVTTGGGVVTPLATVTDSLGRFAFNWRLGALVGTQTVTVSSPGATSLVVSATATSTGAVRLRIIQQIAATYQAGDSIPALVVEAQNVSNARDTLYADSVFLGFAVNPAGATLVGTTRVKAVAGVARFDNFRVQKAGTGYRLLTTAAGLGADTSTAFAITPRNASTLALQSGGNQSGTPGAALPAPVVVRVTDPFGNPVAGFSVGFAVAAGSVSAASVNTDAGGLASVTWTLGPAGGAQSLTVTASGLTGSPLTVLANNGGGAVATTTVTPAFDTLTAIGAARTLVATARDASTAVVPGVFTWVSRTPAVATVDSLGKVTAVANGTSWVVATEAGGTRDSSRIVVEQRLATINVSPNTRNLYLSGLATFTASAVDGLGVALATQPTVTWSTGSTAIATVTSGGVVTGVGLGSTQVRATAGAITGVATLNVLTPITRIAVVRDSTGFTVSDTFSLAALGYKRSYRAVAHDTLDAVMTGVTFTWASSNPSVAVLDSTGAATARASAVANGFTAIRATAQGVTGAAALTVAQVMQSVEITPASVVVAVNGSTVLTARRRDANNFYIPGGTFTFASQSPSTATVTNAGVVTGVALGATTVTATSGTITSAPASVTVSVSVPAAISFGRDTLAIGRSATNVSIPVYLSTPSGNAVTVNLAVADTFAFFSPTSITIPAGQTVGTATLNGRSAGTTQVFAVDGGGGGYAGDTAVLAVQATVKLNTTGYSMNVNDERPAQVQLTDPAPAGGSFITFTYGTPGRVSISPDPAFIPAGQLSVDIVIRGLSAGSTTVTPAATGVNGVASTVTTAAAVIQSSTTSGRMGAGQYYGSWYAYVTYNVTNPLVVTLTSSDTTKVRVPATVTIPANTYYVYYDVTGVAPGSATVTASAPGWTGFSYPVVVTTPKVTGSSGGTYNTTQPAIQVYAYSRDSTGNAYPRTSALNVQLTSSDPSVLTVLTPTVTIPAGQYYNPTPGQVINGGNPGTAKLYVTASGHTGDSTTFTFVGPKLSLSWTANRVGAGQQDANLYVATPNNVGADLVVTLLNSDSTFAAAKDTVVIPAGTYYTYFNVRGKAPGLSTFIATAPGFSPDTATYRVTTPRLTLNGGTTLNEFGAPAALTAYTVDSVGTVHTRTTPLIVSYTSTNPAVVSVTAADTVQTGSYYANNARATAVAAGTAQVIATAPGHGADTTSFTVATPKLNFSFSTYRIGRRTYRPPNEQYVYIPNARGTPVTVTFTQTNATADSLSSTSVVIPGTSYYSYFGFAGRQAGTDTIIASAPGYLPDTAVVVISSSKLTVSGLPGTATTTSPPTTLTVYVTDSVGNSHFSLDTILISARSSNTSVIQPQTPDVRLLPGNYYVQPQVVFVGAGSASMTYADSLGLGYGSATTNAVTVTGPSLGIYNSAPMLGMRQNSGATGAYVTIPNPIGTPLTVNLVSTDPSVATVPASVTIPANTTYAYFRIDAHDVVGTVQIQASATGYSPVNTTQQVTAPRFLVSAPGTINTTAPPGSITVYAADAAGTFHYVNEDVTVTLASSSEAVGRIDSTTVVIATNAYFNNNARFVPVSSGTVQVSATDTRGTAYSYATGTVNVSVTVPTLYLGWGGALPLGVGQYVDQYVAAPNNPATPLTVTLSHLTSASASPANVVIPNNTYYIYHRITGVSVGNDSITYSASGHNSIVGAVAVGQGRVDGLGGWPGTLSSDSVQVTLYARAPDGSVRNVTSATTFNLSISSGAFTAHVGGATVTSVTIPADGNQVSFWLRRVANGTGNVTFTNANYTTYVSPTVTVTGAP